MKVLRRAAIIVWALTSSACGESAAGAGNVQIFVVPESTITDGLEPGTDPESVQDGWTISYRRYLVAVGNFRARRSDTGDSISDGTSHVLDMKNAPTSGYVVKEFRDVAAVRWDKFGYDVPNAKSGMKALCPDEKGGSRFHDFERLFRVFRGRGGERRADDLLRMGICGGHVVRRLRKRR